MSLSRIRPFYEVEQKWFLPFIGDEEDEEAEGEEAGEGDAEGEEAHACCEGEDDEGEGAGPEGKPFKNLFSSISPLVSTSFIYNSTFCFKALKRWKFFKRYFTH